MSYEIGEVVIVSDPGTPYTQKFKGQRGAITGYEVGGIFPYGVTFANGYSLGFAEEELSPAIEEEEELHDPVNRPRHYRLPNGLEAIEVTQHFNFNLGNALKYIMRAGRKGDAAEDLQKAARYLKFELTRLESN